MRKTELRLPKILEEERADYGGRLREREDELESMRLKLNELQLEKQVEGMEISRIQHAQEKLDVS